MHKHPDYRDDPVEAYHEDRCRECGRDLGAGYLCDDCDTVDVIEDG